MDFGLKEARALLEDEVLWPKVRDYLSRGGEFKEFPKGVEGRMCLLGEETQKEICLWCEALSKAEEWHSIVSAEKVRELKASYPGVYPDVFRYESYFSKFKPIDPKNKDVIEQVMKLKFPEAYKLCCL